MPEKLFELKLDLESAQALRDLAGTLGRVFGEMEQSDATLIRTFEEVWDSLGIHAADIQQLINIATDAERSAREAASELPAMMVQTAEKIEAYVAALPGGGVPSAPIFTPSTPRTAPGHSGAGGEDYARRMSQGEVRAAWQSTVESVDQQIKNYREALMRRGVPDCPWLARTLAGHRTRMLQFESGQLERAGGRSGQQDAAPYRYPGDYEAFYDGLAREFQKHCLKGTNPRRGEGAGWASNCQRCVPAYEMRRRGLEVTAAPNISDSRYLVYHPYAMWENPEILRTRGNGLEDIRRAMSAWGDGTRAQIVVAWNDSFGTRGYTFVAEQQGRKTLFFDPQDGIRDAQLLFARAAPDRTTFCRIDNLKPSAHMAECCVKEEAP